MSRQPLAIYGRRARGALIAHKLDAQTLHVVPPSGAHHPSGETSNMKQSLPLLKTCLLPLLHLTLITSL